MLIQAHCPPPPAAVARLRETVLGFLAAHEQPGRWTFFRAGCPGRPLHGARHAPDIVVEVNGRIAYVELQPHGAGPLPVARRTALSLARTRGAACFVVRSLPEMERVLRELGIALRPPRRMADDGLTDKKQHHGPHP